MSFLFSGQPWHNSCSPPPTSLSNWQTNDRIARIVPRVSRKRERTRLMDVDYVKFICAASSVLLYFTIIVTSKNKTIYVTSVFVYSICCAWFVCTAFNNANPWFNFEMYIKDDMYIFNYNTIFFFNTNWFIQLFISISSFLHSKLKYDKFELI